MYVCRPVNNYCNLLICHYFNVLQYERKDLYT